MRAGPRLESNFRQGRTVSEADIADQTDRVWDFDGAKTAIKETLARQMRYARSSLELQNRERSSATETRGGEVSDHPANPKSVGRAQVADQLATVRAKPAIVTHTTVTAFIDEFDR
jgi:hypothetical protein